MELMGIALVGVPAVLDLRQGRASRPLVGDLTATELVGAEEAYLGARVLTVCDVYDALVSHRVSRPAWSRERALALLHEESGAAFDPRCVAGLERVLDRVAGQPGWVATFADAPAVHAAASRR